MNKLIINFTPTGMVPTKQMTPSVPLSPEEIIDEVLKASQLGITIVHLHARDHLGKPTYRKEIYAEIISGIRQIAPELIICVSLSGRDHHQFHQRSDPLMLEGALKPDMASLTLSSLNFSKQASINSPQMIQTLAGEMNQRGIVPELEVFDLGMLNYTHYLIKKEILQPPYYFNIILGNIAGAQCELLQIATILQGLPPDCIWSLGGIGSQQLPANSIAIATGGGVRIGLEDNLFLDGQLTTNCELLGRVHQLAQIHQRELMSSEECRKLLRINRNVGQQNQNPDHGGWPRKKVG